MVENASTGHSSNEVEKTAVQDISRRTQNVVNINRLPVLSPCGAVDRVV